MGESAQRVTYQFGPFQVDPAQRLLRSRTDGEPIPLTSKAFETLLYLVEHHGELIDKTTLMKAVWPNVVVEENNLNQSISALRRAFGETALEHRFIVTVPGRGYRFVAPVRTLTTSALPTTGRLRLAILPFENLSPDPANAFFADGLQEDIISTLASRAPRIEVVSRTTMMLYRKAPKSIAEVANELGATHVIEGSLRREAKSVRLTLQLIDGATDNHIWSQTYDRTLKDALTLQSEVAREVTSQLAVQLAGGERRGLTTDIDAYDFFLKAKLLRKQLDPVSQLVDVERIDSLLGRAIARDADFGMAYIERANHFLSGYLASIHMTQDRLRQVRADLDVAARLVPGDATLQATEVLYRRTIGTDMSVQPIIGATAQTGVDPSNLYFLNAALMQAGRFEESLALAQRWATLDPANIIVLTLQAWNLEMSRKPEEALRVYDIITARSGTDFYSTLSARTLFAYTGRTEALRAALKRLEAFIAPDRRIIDEFEALRFEQRYADLKRLLDETSLDSARRIFDIYSWGLGRRPMAQMRGWTALLLGDEKSALAESQALVSFVATAPRMPTNGWYLSTLVSEAHLFAGNKTAAIEAAKQCLALTPRVNDTFAWHGSAISAARVFAWAGAGDWAVDLLEQLATVIAGLGPAEITRDPLYSVPLAGNPQYRALAERLEAQMRSTEL